MSWKHLLGIKEESEVRAEVERQPQIKEARAAIQRADRILGELETIERLNLPAKHDRRATDMHR